MFYELMLKGDYYYETQIYTFAINICFCLHVTFCINHMFVCGGRIWRKDLKDMQFIETEHS